MENDKIKELCDMQKTLITCLKSVIDSGIMNADTKEVGEVADIIKDLGMTEKYAREAEYYKLVAEAMEDSGPSGYGMGYTRTNSSGGRTQVNRSMGYTRPFKPMVDQEQYIDGYMHDPDFTSKMGGEYGAPYNEYMAARRHYTETKSSSDRSMMDARAKEHLDQTIETMEDIWEDATPELRSKMKTDLKRLIDTMV